MKAIVIFCTMIGVLVAGSGEADSQKNGDFHIYTVDNKNANIKPKMIQDALKSSGFVIAGNADIQVELLNKYEDNNFKIYNNISFYHREITLKLLNKQADAGVLVPMGMVVYQGLNENDLHIVVTTAAMQAKVIGVDAQELQDLEDAVLSVITTLFPTATHTYNDKSTLEQRELLTKYTLDLKKNHFKDTDMDDFKDAFEKKFEVMFEEAGFAMPSYFDLTYKLGKNSPYDFYVTYAICKIDVLRTVAKVTPKAAVLGPCTTMIYKKKNEDKIVMGFASMYNWISSAHVKDKASVDGLLETQSVYENMLKEMTQN